MAKTVGQKDSGTVNNIRAEIWEDMLDELVITEVLFYHLVEEHGLQPRLAEFYALGIFRGGGKMTSCKIEGITADMGRKYAISSKQAWKFMLRYLKSSRIQIIDEHPNVWQVNGFSTFERPYIAGYESILHDMMNVGRVGIDNQ